MRAKTILSFCTILFFFTATSIRGQDEDDEESRFSAGVRLIVQAEGRNVQQSLAFRIAFVERDGKKSPASTRTWTGRLESEVSGQYTFAAQLKGRLQVDVGGHRVLEAESDQRRWVQGTPIELDFDQHEIHVVLEAGNSEPAELTLFWSGPSFRFEPIPRTSLSHERAQQLESNLGAAEYVRALRCEACHTVSGRPALRAPSLQHVGRTLRTDWLQDFLTQSSQSQTGQTVQAAWRNFHQRFSSEQARDVTAFLQAGVATRQDPTAISVDADDVTAGRSAVMSLGCLACHRVNELGSNDPLSGGELTDVATKRPSAFFSDWLRDPQAINPDHRMPHYDLSSGQRDQIAAYLSTLGETKPTSDRRLGEAERGGQLVAEFRCAACHRLDDATARTQKSPLTADSNWSASCLTNSLPDRPDFKIGDKQLRDTIHRAAIQLGQDRDLLKDARLLLSENNCLSCHPRGGRPGIAPVAQQIASAHAEFVEKLPELTPPSLNAVGDKLHDNVLRKAIQRTGDPLRPWLEVRMPTFQLSKKEVDLISRYFVSHDRVADEAVEALLPDEQDFPVAERLVTADGFGCTSCHAIGKVQPIKPPRGGMAPNLARLGSRVRRVWFDRWVRNPARMVPRMEMPSIQVAVPNVLENDLDRQLAALWGVLDQRRFQPPDPLPVRIVGQPSVGEQPAIVLTDVVKHNGTTFVRPLLIGLSNRQNVLFDLERGRLVDWWTGNTARQRTQGKTWFWESPGLGAPDQTSDSADFSLVRNNQSVSPHTDGQFISVADQWNNQDGGVRWRHRLRFPVGASSAQQILHVVQSILPEGQGWRREIQIQGLRRGDQISIQLEGGVVDSESNGQASYRVIAEGDRVVLQADDDGNAALNVSYEGAGPEVAGLPVTPNDDGLQQPKGLDAVVPGFVVTRLPLAPEVMPIALAWKPDGSLLLGSLKGRVWSGADSDGDGLEDRFRPISDELAAPYGIHAANDYIDVVNKYGVVRLRDDDGDGVADQHVIVASGWGHTDDYHDWVVGLPADEEGNYYVAIPCQQDDRTKAAAHLRGRVLKLRPRTASDDDPRLFDLETVSAGHRFPMGIARNRDGQLFVTDNQGNYNPFNELNHVVPGAHFGFINKLEQKPGYQPELTPPAIDIPHPWTRSVNGICFLESPAEQPHRFGPFEGHLVGCEYDTRRLVRMSLQAVDGLQQGCIYPLSDPSVDESNQLLGPITSQVSPTGDLYVGCIRDSGWGGANNTGTIVKIVPELGKLPVGISEVLARPGGFIVQFTRPIDRSKAHRKENYTIESVRRISTPVYGGDDVDRRSESIADVSVAADGMSVQIGLTRLRAGFVYEFRLKNIASEGDRFFPAEAFYTLRREVKSQ